ncbi:homologous recombination OB-fold protein [Heteronotia binoei]|uniref:homologous recombination OB-fold protein n=1 Tax=Heteronotia binoei TaxID=13085 RepID=UPI00292ED685|nr:homologous recombination OB-fold protein [Heteronotia binoei]
MACGIQKLFSVEAEFEDEDFVLAVEDAEKQVSGPAPASSRCLRPSSAALRNPSDSGEALSPVLPLQNYSRLSILQGSCPDEIKNNQVTSPSVASFRAQEDQTASWAQSGPGCKSGPKFKFVKRHIAAPSPHNEDLDNELFLAACMDLETSETLSFPEPSGSDLGSHRVSETVTAKKMRVADSAMTNSAIGVETARLNRTSTEAFTGVGGHLRSAEASPRLTLRPTAVGSHSSQSNQGVSIPVGNISSPGCQLPKLFRASLDKPGAGPNTSRLPLIRPASPSGVALPRPLSPQIPSQSSFTLKTTNRAPQLFSAHCPLMTSVESSPATPRTPCSVTPSGSLQMPVVTNHLVRLVTAANKPPQPLAHVPLQAKSRRFPGPAGILPQQPDRKNLEEIMVSAPQTPTHGALAKLRTEDVPASQQPAEDCGRDAWVAMKTELGLDERDPSCFLRTYSVAMVLRKAALKQLPKNKVLNMAVMIKSLTRTNVDAGAVFRDPTGEMQGTIHRLLLEQRESEFKAGSVLLLKQVGVFSPSHRNHYLNVTPNNLVKIYPPGLGSRKPTQPREEIRGGAEMVLPQAESGFQQDSPTDAPPTVAATDFGKEHSDEIGKNCCLGPLASSQGAPFPEDGGMGKSVLSMSSPKSCSDDLDQLLGQLPDDFFSNPDAQSAL